MDGYYGYGIGWFGWLVMIILMVLFWAGLLATVALVTRRYWQPRRGEGAGPSSAGQPTRPGPSSSESDPNSPEGVLSARFARGEIDEEEFRKRRDALRG